MEKKKGLCGICPDKCWIEATIENGKLVKVEPDKDSPFGRVCPRGALSKEIIYSKDRILHPMVRIGKKEKENSGEQPGKRHWKRLLKDF